MDFATGAMGPSRLHYSFEKTDVTNVIAGESQTATQPQVNDKLIAHFHNLCERHPTWTFGQIASGLHVDAATLRQIEIVTNSRLRSARAR
ncbi:helix-turn-helix domain-containing protein [Weissella fangxianensis]|uniref:helix-turn-helix domain-containing protein n=1 Tax=Weissella fangxianensis TaxID=2953879 RepID=UPI00215831A6|nr:helix-turn-helix domain-containing protein [Weissella fangxianensis]